MSRWQEQFDNHPFQTTWEQLKELVKETKVDDESIITDVEEVARLSKVIGYLEQMIESIDPELVPASTWNNFNNQCQPCLNEISSFKSNRNIQHIVNANSNADNLLTYVRPYVVESGKAAKAAHAGFRSYQKSISQGLEDFKHQALEYYREFKEVSDEFRDEKIEFKKQFQELKETHEEVEGLRKQYFEGTETEDAIQAKIDEMVTKLEKYYLQISDYHTELLESGSDSIKTQVATAKSEAENDAESIGELLRETEKQLSFLQSFYKDVRGKEDEEGNLVGGLKAEITSRQKDLDAFKVKQEERYNALNEQIEELLPGATSAGLAAAYRAMRKSFTKPIKQYSRLFYVSIAVLSLTAFISIIDGVWTADSFIKFIDVTDYKNLLSNLTHKLPIILPVLWLALFASKRRSEALRLQQEYSHKEALAKSYQNFKNQVDNLHSDKKEELLEKLLGAAIDAVAANASDTLDKKHGDKTPAHEGLDKTVSSLEKLKGIFK
ncbi:hypothetical protein PALB_29250 [Pseudoalteromonas luteoviolacea B = ATCC 29581]|nr:hypothetical protein PALB_29250 [Pseudoalteromonas luteoviolacea B = ATCC 29581]